MAGGMQSGEFEDAVQTLIDVLRRLKGGAESGEDGGHADEPSGAASPVAQYGCRSFDLPEHLRADAAAKAVMINPQNAPPASFLRVISQAAELSDMTDSLGPAAVLSVTKWFGPKVQELPVYFMSGGPVALQNRIVKQMNEWNEHCGISFRRTNSNSQGIVRISFDGKGYWSVLGTDVLGRKLNEPTMNLQAPQNLSDSEFRRLVLHECGHTLGLQHEQLRKDIVARIDRQKAYQWFGKAPNNWSKQMVDFNVLTPLDDTNLETEGGADEISIMCYMLPASIMKDGKAVSGGKTISATDAWFVGAIYPKGGAAASLERPAGYADALALVAQHSATFGSQPAGGVAAAAATGGDGPDWNHFDDLLGL